MSNEFVVDLPGVAVVGAGLAGCLTACYLRRRGFAVDLLESRPDMRRADQAGGRSINLVLTSRGFNALNKVGLLPRILALCTPVYGRGLHSIDGTASYQSYGPDPSFCNYSISRAELNMALLNACEEMGVRIHFDHSIDHIDVKKKTITSYLRDPCIFKRALSLRPGLDRSALDGKQFPVPMYGLTLRARHIFACDGAGSRGRHALHMALGSSVALAARVASPLPDCPAPYTTHVDNGNKHDDNVNNLVVKYPIDSAHALRGSFDVTSPLGTRYVELLLPNAADFEKQTGRKPDRTFADTVKEMADPENDLTLRECAIPPSAALLDPRALHIWPRGSHFLMGLPNKDGSFTMTLYLPEVAVKGQPSLKSIQTEEEVLEYFTHYYPNVIALMPTLTQQYLHNPKGFLGAVQCFPWHYTDSLVLLGDAAHAINPFFGQGCNAAFESVEKLFHYADKAARMRVKDCHVFTECTPILSPTTALQKYTPGMATAFRMLTTLHKPNTDAICTMAVENYFEMMAKTGDEHFLKQKSLENKLANAFPDVFLSRYAMVTHTLIPYYSCMALGAAQQRILDQLLPRPSTTANTTANTSSSSSSASSSSSSSSSDTPTSTAAESAAAADTPLDMVAASQLVQQLLVPLLNRFHLTSHDLRDVTRELVQSVHVDEGSHGSGSAEVGGKVGEATGTAAVGTQTQNKDKKAKNAKENAKNEETGQNGDEKADVGVEAGKASSPETHEAGTCNPRSPVPSARL